jgi:hypothetical protein
MSWSLGVTGKKVEELGDALDEAFERNYADAHEAVKLQFHNAKIMVNHILTDEKGVAAVKGELFNVGLTGHSQEAMPGSAMDSMSVSVSAATVPTTV